MTEGTSPPLFSVVWVPRQCSKDEEAGYNGSLTESVERGDTYSIRYDDVRFGKWEMLLLGQVVSDIVYGTSFDRCQLIRDLIEELHRFVGIQSVPIRKNR